MNALEQFGWNSDWEQALRNVDQTNLEPARVVADSREVFVCIAAGREVIARPAGRLRHEATFPVTGDWAGLEQGRCGSSAILRAVLPRRSSLARRAAGSNRGDDVIAANVDRALIVTSVGRDFNPRRIDALSLAGIGFRNSGDHRRQQGGPDQ